MPIADADPPSSGGTMLVSQDVPKEAVKRSGDLLLQNVFGVTAPVRAVQFVSDTQATYTIGQYVSLYNIETKTTTILSRGKSVQRKVTSVCAAAYSSLVAVCEGRLVDSVETGNLDDAAGDGLQTMLQVSVFHVPTKRKMRSMYYGDAAFRGSFDMCAFSSDAKVLVTVSSGVPSHMVVWKWESEKIEASTRFSSPVLGLQFRPSEMCSVSVCGDKLLRLWKHSSEHGVKSQPLLPPKVEAKETFTDHAWVPYSALVAITPTANIYISFPSTGKQKSKPKPTPSSSASSSSSSPATSGSGSGSGVGAGSGAGSEGATASGGSGGAPSSGSSWMYEVAQVVDVTEMYPGASNLELTCVVGTEKGFTVCSNLGHLLLFEYRSMDEETFVCCKRFEDHAGSAFISMTLSPTGEDLLLTTLQRQVVWFPFGKSSIMKEKDNLFKPVPCQLHRSAIRSMSMCALRPLVVTMCDEGLLQIINHRTMDCELQHRFTEVPVAVAMHPAGMLLVVVFRDKIKLLAVLLNGLKDIGEVALHGCTRVLFTNGGHYFCCLTQTTLYVFATYSAQIVHTLPADSGYMRSMNISANDQFVAAADADGNVSSWSLTEGSAVPELSVTVDQAQVREALLCGASKLILVSCSDDVLRVYCKGSLKAEIASSGYRITAVLLAADESALFVGYSSGNIRIYEWPIQKTKVKPRFTEFAGHGVEVAHLSLSSDGSRLVSAGQDGSLFFFTVSLKARLKSSRSGEHAFSLSTDVVLVSRGYLNDQEATLLTAKKQLVDEKHSLQFVLSRKDAEWELKLKSMREELAVKLDQEKYTREQLQGNFDAVVKKEAEARELRHVQSIKRIQEIENEYEHKLAAAARRYDKLSETLEHTRQDHQRQTAELRERLRAQEASSSAEIAELRSALGDKDAKLQDELGVVKKRHEEMLRQQEAEYEGEIVRVKEGFRVRMGKEVEKAAVTEAKAIQHQNRIATLRNKLAEAKGQHARAEKENSELCEKLRRLEEKIRQNEQDFAARRANAKQTETHLAVLRSSNKTLDNFRYVLDYRIDQLTQEKGPTQQHIQELEAHIRQMYEEMVIQFNENKAHHRAAKTKEAKLLTLQNEIHKLRQSLAHKERRLSSLHYAISAAAKRGDPKFAHNTIADMYKLHVLSKQKDSDSHLEIREQGDAPPSSAENQRQRQFMEKTIVALKKSVEIANAKVIDKGHRNLKENASLIAECNRLRKQLVDAQNKVAVLTERAKRNQRQSFTNQDDPTPFVNERQSVKQRPATGHGSRKSSEDREGLELQRASRSAVTHSAASKQRPQTSQARSSLPRAVLSRGGQRPSTTSSSTTGKPSRRVKDRRDNLVRRLLQQLDENTREIAMQRTEIARLRETSCLRR